MLGFVQSKLSEAPRGNYWVWKECMKNKNVQATKQASQLSDQEYAHTEPN